MAIHWAEHLGGILQNFADGELGRRHVRIFQIIEWVDSMEESSIKLPFQKMWQEKAKQNPLAAGEWVLTIEDGDASRLE